MKIMATVNHGGRRRLNSKQVRSIHLYTSMDSTVTIIIRVIRSFEYRNIRNVVLKNISLSLTTEELKAIITQELHVAPGFPPPFRKYDYDTLKIEHHAHGAKTNDPVINSENDEILVLKSGLTLKESGIKNETEISFFKYIDYMAHKQNPILKFGST